MGFVQTHFMAYAMDVGFDAILVGSGMGGMGIMSVVGSLGLGLHSDRTGRRRGSLALAYSLRGVGFVLLAGAGALGSATVLMTSVVVIGLSWAATISLTTAACADHWGRAAAGTVTGVALGVMWLGNAVGAYLPAVIATVGDSYTAALWVNAALGIAAAALIQLGPEVGPAGAPARA
jgi:MFS family permease